MKKSSKIFIGILGALVLIAIVLALILPVGEWFRGWAGGIVIEKEIGNFDDPSVSAPSSALPQEYINMGIDQNVIDAIMNYSSPETTANMLSGKIPSSYLSAINQADNNLAFYVDDDGSPTGTGTKEDPMDNITNAIAWGRVFSAGDPSFDSFVVYVAEGNYDENNEYTPFENQFDAYGSSHIKDIFVIGGYSNGFTSWNPSTNKSTVKTDVNGGLFNYRGSGANGAIVGLDIENRFTSGQNYNQTVLLRYVNNFLFAHNTIRKAHPDSFLKVLNVQGTVDVLDNTFMNQLTTLEMSPIWINPQGGKVNFQKNLLKALNTGDTTPTVKIEGDILFANNYLIGNNGKYVLFPLGPETEVKIFNNTFGDNVATGLIALGKDDLATIKNNLFVNNSGDNYMIDDDNFGLGNVFDSNASDGGTVYDQDFICNPQVPNDSGSNPSDFVLGDNSDCKDRGAVVSLNFDYFGNTRPFPSGGNYDAGAHESQTEAPACGDGTVDTGEECDDGNTTNGDGCSSTCTTEAQAACGDGTVDTGEECDDGNTTSGDGCSATCNTEAQSFCGDGIVDPGEDCDDGNNSDLDNCLRSCVLNRCGDEFLNTGVEECDPGSDQLSDTVPDACRTDCTNPACGDGVVDTGEECDDGNTTSGDGCSDTCNTEAQPSCGDGTVDAGEECDDGNTTSGDGCSSTCTTEAQAACGDGTVDTGEECDDGNTTSGDGCSSTCTDEVLDILENVNSSPNSFIPADGEKVSLLYELNVDANVDVSIYRGSSLVVELFDDLSQNAGSYNIKWNGKVDGSVVDTGTYSLRVSATAQGSTEQEEDSFEVDDPEPVPEEITCEGQNVRKPEINDEDIDPSVFNPDEELAYITFDLNTCAKINVRIWQDGEIVETLTENIEKDEGTYEYRWDGQDENGDYVDEGFYTYQVYAVNSEGSDAVNDVFEVDYEKDPGGDRVAEGDRCAGFIDVAEDNYYCPALEYTVDDIECVTGYPDGTAKLNKFLNRAEATKLVTLCLEFPISNHRNQFLFEDIQGDNWFNDYVFEAKQRGMVQGYPDGTFRPLNEIVRVEYLKIVLEGLEIPVTTHVYNYTDKLIDVIKNSWYEGYANYALKKELIKAVNDKYLNPAQGITRGDAIQMIYELDQKGLK